MIKKHCEFAKKKIMGAVLQLSDNMGFVCENIFTDQMGMHKQSCHPLGRTVLGMQTLQWFTVHFQ